MSTSPKRVDPPKADDTWLSPKNDISHLITDMTPDKVEAWVEYCAEVCDSVEFLHGVPVQLPSQTKALLRGRVREALTQYHQDLMSEVENYWYYAGEWHDAGCAFVCVDHGVCNCDLEANKTIIKSLGK